MTMIRKFSAKTSCITTATGSYTIFAGFCRISTSCTAITTGISGISPATTTGCDQKCLYTASGKIYFCCSTTTSTIGSGRGTSICSISIRTTIDTTSSSSGIYRKYISSLQPVGCYYSAAFTADIGTVIIRTFCSIRRERIVSRIRNLISCSLVPGSIGLGNIHTALDVTSREDFLPSSFVF